MLHMRALAFHKKSHSNTAVVFKVLDCFASIRGPQRQARDLHWAPYGASSHRLGHAQASLGATLGSLHFFNRSVVFLKALHRTMSVPCGRNSLHGVVGTGVRGDVRHLVLDGGLADGAFVLDGVALCPRRIDDEVHLLVQDDVENVRAAFSNLVHHFALDTGSFVELGGAFGSVDLEAELLEFLTDFDSLFGEVHLVRKADEHSAFGREEGTGGFLALVVSEGVVVGEAEDFDYDDRSAYASLSPSTTR